MLSKLSQSKKNKKSLLFLQKTIISKMDIVDIENISGGRNNSTAPYSDSWTMGTSPTTIILTTSNA